MRDSSTSVKSKDRNVQVASLYLCVRRRLKFVQPSVLHLLECDLRVQDPEQKDDLRGQKLSRWAL